MLSFIMYQLKNLLYILSYLLKNSPAVNKNRDQENNIPPNLSESALYFTDRKCNNFFELKTCMKSKGDMFEQQLKQTTL